MQLTRLQLKHFRCFNSLDLSLTGPLVVISGCNGSGKTSILEALHYAGYLRSFRTHLPRELVQFDAEAFSIKIAVENEDAHQHEIAVGVSDAKKVVKLNQKVIESYKQLTDYYRVVAVTDDDLALIKGAPELRRSYLDQALALYNPAYLAQLRTYKNVLVQRNALLAQYPIAHDVYDVLTQQLWRYSCAIANQRQELLALLQQRVDTLLATTFPSSYTVTLSYETKGYELLQEYDTQTMSTLKARELVLKRSLFGAHLDDFALSFKEKRSRSYASRGQQKLMVLLLKIAQIQELRERKGSAIVLLDDFMNDFDQPTATLLLELLKRTASQLVFTSPMPGTFLEEMLRHAGSNFILLPS